ncbi:MAG: outer membrane lipoprotein-sorting protein [Bacteroidia bacterium]|nr:outer membrane lipoprotein-sorting protein [Bacteroidia bacterium]NNF30000.1 outer membrane lipoprotein-sorting protein [Flavobacteriaceae bacterium]NNJ83204.1 outer membrane lipoprotein-sorting protein [Flavobacteriaceae bacterium]NNK53705.1 outer membrane lipoprotein-sorting protein [Flavobacteriaceae bacterium]NNM09274.1 outer membrane lipoprotein-sorting protein [Flavobacteriaceae bacterium]
MRTIRTLFTCLLVTVFIPVNAQTADEIIANYLENTGGIEAWESIQSMTTTGDAMMGGQSYPFVQTMMEDGRMVVNVDLQGMNFVPQAFDGERMWTTNFQSMEAEAMDEETSSNYKNNEANDFPEALLNYKEKGYSVELVGEEMMEGTECHKIKLTKNPVMVDGEEKPNVATYYLDKENFVPIVIENTVNSGPMAGTVTQTVFSEYLEAGDLFLPYSITQKFNGQAGQTIKITKIEFNAEVDESLFVMPEATETEEEDKN